MIHSGHVSHFDNKSVASHSLGEYDFLEKNVRFLLEKYPHVDGVEQEVLVSNGLRERMLKDALAKEEESLRYV